MNLAAITNLSLTNKLWSSGVFSAKPNRQSLKNKSSLVSVIGGSSAEKN